ncbi:Repressor of RNA polymerase III transcription MAF1-like protein [Aphelenchoides bicaudatus]|nr:Repressor of RNA polymerase III transcription MAF1-like protein [Aphelenchoides bicaudatus]
MKLLDSESLENVEHFVKNHARDFELDFRLESYSCKMIKTDKKEWQRNVTNKTEMKELQPLSPPEDSYFYSQFSNFSGGRLRHSSEVSHSGSDNDVADEPPVIVGTVSRRTLFSLVSVLNLSFADYDFTQTKSDRFTLASISECLKNVEAKFLTAMPDYFGVKDQFWNAVDEEININESILFSYIPDFADDPYTSCIWSFNYFFWNRQRKRVLFLSCRALGVDTMEQMSNEDGVWIGVN